MLSPNGAQNPNPWSSRPYRCRVKNSMALVELYRPSESRMSAMLMPTFADRGCRVVSETDPTAVNLDFIDPAVEG
jgi:hypothetical protein